MPRLMNAVPRGFVSWYGFAEAVIEKLKETGINVTAKTIEPISSGFLNQKATRPTNSRLNNQKLENFIGKPLDNWTTFLHDLVLKVINQRQK